MFTGSLAGKALLHHLCEDRLHADPALRRRDLLEHADQLVLPIFNCPLGGGQLLGFLPAAAAAARSPRQAPAVSVRKSLASKDHIISMIDGKPYRTLRRHLSTHGLTPEEYRERYNLRADYPMVAPSYSEARRAMAHKIGLGAKGRKSRSSGATAAKPGVRKSRSAEASEG